MASQDDEITNIWQRRQKNKQEIFGSDVKYLVSDHGRRNMWQRRDKKYLASEDDEARNTWQRRQKYLAGEYDETTNTWPATPETTWPAKKTTRQEILDNDAKNAWPAKTTRQEIPGSNVVNIWQAATARQEILGSDAKKNFRHQQTTLQ